MTAAVDLHHHLPSSAGNARVYAQQLLVRICSRWGTTPEAFRVMMRGRSRPFCGGRPPGNGIIRTLIVSDLLLGLEGHMLGVGPGNPQLLTADMIGAMVAITPRSISRYRRELEQALGRRLTTPGMKGRNQ